MIDDPTVLSERLRMAGAALQGLETVCLVQAVLAEMPLDHVDRPAWIKLGLDGLRLASLAGDRLVRLDAAPDAPASSH